MNNDFKEENNKFREYQRALQGYKRQLNRIQQEQRKADWEMRRKEAEGPIDADVPSDDPLIGHPWAEEILQVAYNPTRMRLATCTRRTSCLLSLYTTSTSRLVVDGALR